LRHLVHQQQKVPGFARPGLQGQPLRCLQLKLEHFLSAGALVGLMRCLSAEQIQLYQLIDLVQLLLGIFPVAVKHHHELCRLYLQTFCVVPFVR
jgi:hypothetical protein